MILDLVTLNDQRLRIASSEVNKIDKKLVDLINDMYDTLAYSNGVGLSAVQVGVMKRIFITDVPQKGGKIIAINPVIKDMSEKKRIYEEGCLSVPGITADLERPDSVILEYTDIDGKSKRIKASGLFATCIQHEFDHLNGVLFIDRLDPEKKINKLNEYRLLKSI
jgi:peptide deformylase